MSYLEEFKRMAQGRSLPGVNGVDKAADPVKAVKALESRINEGSLGDNATIAKTIIQQMGGKMKSMLGATLTAVENGLQIKWPNKKRSLGNVCVVTLRPDDTYDMEFFNGAKSVKKFEELHAEDLIPTFETHTGWYLHL